MNDKCSIIIPCYNEERSIPLILKKFAALLENDTISLEVILVDNGSTDGSAAVINGLLPFYPFARSIRVEENQGYGYGILQGLNVAVGEYIGWTHADLQTDPKDVIEAFVQIGDRKNVFVKGNRKSRPFFDRFFTFGMSLFETILLHKVMWDINAQPSIFPKAFFETWQNPPHDFSLDLYAYYLSLKRNLTVVRIPVEFPPRLYGESHWNTGPKAKWKFIKRTIVFSLNLKKRSIK